MAATLRFLNLNVHRPLARGVQRDHGPEGPRLQLATEAGTVRYVPLDRAQLVQLITAAAGAIATLDREEGRP